MGDVIPAIVLMVYTFVFFWFVGGLSGFHCYLTASNQTTYENFRCASGLNLDLIDLGVVCTLNPHQATYENFRCAGTDAMLSDQ